MYRIVIPFCFLLFLVSCSGSADKNGSALLKDKKYSIDSLINKERTLTVMAKVKGKEGLGAMPKEEKEVETIYNIFRNKKGEIIYISEIPKSPDNEWFIAYKSYFDDQGKLFAFQLQNNFFHSECAKAAAMENLIKYYNNSFEVIDSTYTLTDTYKKDLDKATCKFPYNFPYKVYKSVAEYRNGVQGL